MIATVIYKIDVAITQFAMCELHVGIVAMLRVVEVRGDMQRAEHLVQFLAGIYCSLPNLMHATSIAEQLRRKLSELRLIVGQ